MSSILGYVALQGIQLKLVAAIDLVDAPPFNLPSQVVARRRQLMSGVVVEVVTLVGGCRLERGVGVGGKRKRSRIVQHKAARRGR